MKKIIYAIGLIAFSITSCQQQTDNVDLSLNNEADSLSYAIGLNIADGLSKQEIKINGDILASAFKDLADSTNVWDPRDADKYIQTVLAKRDEAKAQEAKAEGRNFLVENASKPNIKTTPSGLQYEIIEEGSGDHPKPTDKVSVHYTGKLIDGTVFDSSVERGQPATFGLNQVIPGWTEGIQLMKKGGKIRLYIPENLGYGAQAPPGSGISPYSTLIFDVELLEINPEETKK